MKPLLDSWNIHIVGQWNPRIFSPHWVNEYLISSERTIVEGAFPSLHHKLTFNNTIIIPTGNRLIIGTNSFEENALNDLTSVAHKSVDILPHTPIQGLGFNIAFYEEESTLFDFLFNNLEDNGKLADFSSGIKQISSRRVLDFSPGILNLDLSLTSEARAEARFNFHYDVSSAQEIIDIINKSYKAYLNIALDLLKTVYSIDVSFEKED